VAALCISGSKSVAHDNSGYASLQQKERDGECTTAPLSFQTAEVKGCSGSVRGLKADGTLKAKLALGDCGRPLAGCAADDLSDKMIVCHFL